MKTWDDLNLRCQLGLGTWAWGDTRVWGYGKGYTESDVQGAFDASVAAGIVFLDTAEMYGFGTSEHLIGQFMNRSKNTLVVATKFFPAPWRLTGGSLVRALKRSLARLRQSTVDLYQIHWPLHLRSLNTWMDALADAVNAGLTRGVGVSNYSADQMKRAHERLAKHGIPLLSNQVEYSLLHCAPEKNGVRKASNELGVKLIAYSPLAMGVLGGRYSPQHRLTGYRGFRFNRFLPRIQELNTILKKVGEAHGGKTISQVALNWTICQGAFPIPGAKNAAQASENAGAQGWSLTSDEIDEIERAAEMLCPG